MGKVSGANMPMMLFATVPGTTCHLVCLLRWARLLAKLTRNPWFVATGGDGASTLPKSC